MMQQQVHIGLLVAATRRRIKQAVSALVNDKSLSPQQFWTLVVVSEEEGLSLKAMAQRRRMDEPTASRLAFTLTDRGLLSASVDPADRRALRLTLTPRGQALAKRLLPIADDIRNAVEGCLTPQERTAVVSGLHKIIASLDRLEEKHSGRPSPSMGRKSSRRRVRSS
jgi:DNA-binding MarR family transcriptional regulator